MHRIAQPVVLVDEERPRDHRLDGRSSVAHFAERGGTAAAPALDQGQQRAFDIAVNGSNIFITGGPGTGKSFTLSMIICG